jgi:glutathione S-transferase
MLLYSAPLSLFARKVEIALAEKALNFERIMVPFSQARGYSPKHPAVVAANPKGQVPVLVDGELTLYDSTVIVEYLDEAYPIPRLMPRGAAARGLCRLLELEADEVLLQPVKKLMHRTELPGPDVARRKQQEAEAAEAEKLILGNYDALTARLGSQEFFCGAFSLAYIATFIVLHYGIRLGGPSLASHQSLEAWYQRLLLRPGFALAVREIAAADRELSHPVAPRQPGSGK